METTLDIVQIFLEDFKCPLTNLIFLNPVVAEDGYVYEYMAIKFWLNKDDISPITNEKMGNNLIHIKHYKKIINDILNKNPELVEWQFTKKKPYFLFRYEFIQNLLNKHYDKLVIYTDIILNDSLDDSNTTVAKYLFTNCKKIPSETVNAQQYYDDIIKKVIDNSIDFDSYDDNGSKPIHVACRYSNQNIIKYFIDRGVDLNCSDIKGNKPIHYITEYQNNNDMIISHFLDNNLTVFNCNGMLPIHLISKNLSDWSNIQPFIDANCNLEAVSKEGFRPLHYICKYGPSSEIIKKFINLDIQLGCDTEITNKNKTKLSCDQLIYINKNLDKTEKQQLVYHYLNRLLHKTEIINNYVKDSDVKDVDTNKFQKDRANLKEHVKLIDMSLDGLADNYLDI